MKRFYFSKLVILISIFLGWNPSAFAQTSTFVMTGGVQSYTVGVGINALAVDMAGGNGGNANCTGVGGTGGRVRCALAVTPGQILNIYVGGFAPNYVCCGVNPGGYNGGGNGYEYGGGGGGASDI